MRQPHEAYQLTATDLLVISLSLSSISCPVAPGVTATVSLSNEAKEFASGVRQV